MQLQKQFLEANSWVCGKCGCPGGKGWDCINHNHKGYMITLRGAMARVYFHGRVIVSTQLFNLEKKMKEQNLLIKTVSL